MKARTKIQFLTGMATLAACIHLASCKKDEPLTQSSLVAATSDATATATYNVGTGSGSLTIDGKTKAYAAGSVIVIKAGTYQTINVQNLTSVTIENGTGTVVMDGTSDMYAGINFTNCTSVTVTRNPAIVSTSPYGFVIQNVSYRPTTISGINTNLSLEYLSYKNIGDYTIHVTAPTLTQWTGSTSTLQGQNLRLIACNFNGCNAGALQVEGSVTTSAVTGLQKGLEIGWCTFENINSGDVCFAGAVDQYYIHDNVLTNINTTNNDDNGLFHFIGNGSFIRNRATSYQGHMIRMWTLSFGTTPETCLVYDNVGIGSRKYSPFEWQSTAGLNIAAAPNTTYVNIKLCNNTAGDLNTSHDASFGACLVDNYGMPAGSTQEVYNNLLFNAYNAGGTGKIFQFTASITALVLVNQGNLYETSSTTAGLNESALILATTSPAKNKGVSGWLLYADDFHNLPFHSPNPSIGAIE